jgi:type VI secretion system protein ImpL
LVARIPENKICSSLLFPEELARLKGPLECFLKNLFKQTPYQDQPLFRGLYLTSARQEGRPFSHFLEALGIKAGKEQSSGEKSAFLHDFFAKVLVSDRALLTRTSRTLYWQRLSQNLGLGIWVLVGLVLCGLLTLSFVRNIDAMRTAGREVPVELELGTDVLQNIDELERFREALDRLDRRNQKWWTPRMGLVQSRVLQERLSEQYVKLYQDRVIWPLQDQLGRQILTVDASTARSTVAGWVDLLTRRIHLFQGRLAGDDREKLSSFISPDYEFLLKAAYGTTGQTPPSGLSEALARTELAYLCYQNEERPLRRLYQEENERLNNLLRTEGISLLWLSDWANRQTESLQPVTFSRFWGGDTKLEDKVGAPVPRAYTPQGWIKIQAFIKEIAMAMEDPSTMAMYQDAFKKIYWQEYWQAWRAYLTTFPGGERLWPDRTGRRELAARMAGEESPFRQLIREIPRELAPVLDDSEDQPAWATMLLRYLRLQNKEYQKLLDTEDQGVLNRIMTGGSKFFTRLKERREGEAAIQVFRQDQLAYRHMKDCDQANNAFAHQILTPLKAFESAGNAFNEGLAELVMPTHPGLKAFWHGAKLKQTLETDPEAEAPFWGIVQGSYNYLWHFCLAEASFHLQSLWAEEILTEIQDLSKKETIETLLSPEGKAQQFVKGPAGPFIERKIRTGYYPKILLDKEIGFAPRFFAFMNQSQAEWKVLKGAHLVHIEALPTDANAGAKLRPHLTRLVLQCGSGTQELLNFNQGVSASFKWNPEECLGVLLEIHVGDISLKCHYKGKDAFPRFLNDFQKGAKILKSRDFPAKTKSLGNYGISSITVRYQFQGHESLIQSLQKTFHRVPEKIIAEDVYSAVKASKSGNKTRR